MRKQEVAVVIPVYKDSIDENERKSLLQCFKILKDYPFIFACAYNLNTSIYSNAIRENNIQATFMCFEDSYFQSISGYNRLLLSGKFYRRFKAYKYILIYQLDAYVFKDELLSWCEKGFSYIGAPWFSGQDKAEADAGFMHHSGNGGFSLRNIPEFLKLTGAYKVIKSPGNVLKEYSHFSTLQKLFRVPVIVLRFLGLRNNTIYQRSQYQLNEDNYWAFIAPGISSSFKVAKAEEAVGFAFEYMPARMYAMNNNQLPFGCHAWWKYDFDFWKQFIN